MSLNFSYKWPHSPLNSDSGWHSNKDGTCLQRNLPETEEQLAADSRWPAFFPSPICFVTTSDGTDIGFEKVVGPSIVNRFPYIAALSLCRKTLSQRHHPRKRFAELLEAKGSVAIQFLTQSEELATAIKVIAETPDEKTSERLKLSRLSSRPGQTINVPILDDAYLVYEGKLVKPGKDFSGATIYENSYTDVGSHRVYFVEITAIQLREDIAEGKSQIYWKSLPDWSPAASFSKANGVTPKPGLLGHYKKGYSPRYKFPAANTVAFESDAKAHGMAVKHLAPLSQDQVEVDNDKARWPCFFPSPTGMITAWADDHQANLMPCGSTTIISRHPLIIAPCVSYSSINERYAPRASLGIIRKAGSFGCGVAYIDEEITKAIRYSGTTSFANDREKIANSGFDITSRPMAPKLDDLPIHFECVLVGEIRLGTHIMLLGEVKTILVRGDVSTENSMSWCPWADVRSSTL